MIISLHMEKLFLKLAVFEHFISWTKIAHKNFRNWEYYR